jgi:hypothetical protein
VTVLKVSAEAHRVRRALLTRQSTNPAVVEAAKLAEVAAETSEPATASQPA